MTEERVIRVRMGNSADFTPDMMVAGELAAALDEEKVYASFSNGSAKPLASEEYVEKAIAAAKPPDVEIPVVSVNGKTGEVRLSAADVGALPSDTKIPSIEGLASEKYVEEAIAKIKVPEVESPPVIRVNGQTGDVKLTIEDIDTSGYVTDQDLEQALNSLDTAQARITTTVSGTRVLITNAAERPVEGLVLYGRTAPSDNPDGSLETTVLSGSKNQFNMAEMTPTNDKRVVVTHGENTMRVKTTENYRYLGARSKVMPLLGGVTYTLSFIVTAFTAGKPRVGFRGTDDVFISGFGVSSITSTGRFSATFTPGADTEAYLSALVTGSDDIAGDVTFANIQLEIGSTATDFEPYGEGSRLVIHSNRLCAFTVSAGGNNTDENGQRWYSDTVDCAEGSQTQYIKTVRLVGEEAWTQTEYGIFMLELPDALAKGSSYNNGSFTVTTTAGVVTVYAWTNKTLEDWSADGLLNNTFKVHYAAEDDKTYLYVRHDQTTNVGAFITYLSGRDVRLSYILDEPIKGSMSAAEIEAFDSFYAYNLTSISNDRNAFMTVEYVMNTPVATYVTERFERIEGSLGGVGSAEAERGVMKSWEVTATIKATLYDDGLFTVRGSGVAPGYSLTNPPPWRQTQYLSCIERVVFDENIIFSTLGGWFDCVPYTDEYVNEDGSITSFTAYAPCTMVHHRIDIPSTCTATPISAFRALQPVHLNYVKCTSMSTICGETLQYGSHLIMSVPSVICTSTIIGQICDMVEATIARKSRAEMLLVITDSETLFDTFNSTIDNNTDDELIATHNFQCLLFDELGVDGFPTYWSNAEKRIFPEILPLIGRQFAGYDLSTDADTHEWSTTDLTAMSTYSGVVWPNQNCLVNMDGEIPSESIVPAYKVYANKNDTQMPIVKHWPVSTYIAQPRSTALEELTAGLRCAGFVNFVSWRYFQANNMLASADQIFNGWGRFEGEPTLPLVQINELEIRPFDVFAYVTYDENGKIAGGHTGFCLGVTSDGKIQGLHAQRGGIMFGYVTCPTGGAIKFYKRNKLRGLGYGTYRRF